jgi:hypothetical protein
VSARCLKLESLRLRNQVRLSGIASPGSRPLGEAAVPNWIKAGFAGTPPLAWLEMRLVQALGPPRVLEFRAQSYRFSPTGWATT